MASFYATTEDLLPVLFLVESKIKIKYTPIGHSETPQVNAYPRAVELPTLYFPAPYESAVGCPKYLVTRSDAVARPRRISRYDGTTVWAIDQRENPESTVFSHGGRFDDDVLLYGEVRTAYKDPVSQKLQRAFDTAIRNAFTKIQAFRVGQQAEALMRAGVRLTGAKQSPRIYDLAR